jgi:carbamoyl-phosphate synthase small subunit
MLSWSGRWNVFAGQSFGATGTSAGEVVFNTAMSGYQEILTDPSYCGQIVTMTMPMMGNYGVNGEDIESSKQYLSGFVVKELARRYSNHRATGSLHEYLEAAGIIGLAGVDTRALTKRLRERGALRGVISTEISDPVQLVAKARDSSPMEGQHLVKQVMPDGETIWSDESAKGDLHVVAVDCGIKKNILRQLTSAGCAVRVVPPDSSAEKILSTNPRGLLVGNGPGDPAAVSDTIATLGSLIGRLPIFGICLGHQLLSLALGAKTYKLKFGHHGANHPVLNVDTGRVEITSQNHGFAVDIPSLESVGGRVTHLNLYDKSLEGFAHTDRRVFAVQYHPEAAPGPHDSGYLFDQFVTMLH